MKIKNLLAIPAVIAMTMSSAHALTYSPLAQNFNFVIPPSTSSSSLSFAGFDTSLGTLNSVTITLSNVVLTGSVSVTNVSGFLGSPSPQSYDVSMHGVFSVTDSSGNNFNLMVDTPVYNSGVLQPAPTAPFTYTSPSDSSAPGTNSQTFTSGLGIYTTGANVTITASGTGTPTVVGNLGAASISGGATGTVQVTYDYTPVPEPAETSALLLGLGACIMLGRSFLRRKQAA